MCSIRNVEIPVLARRNGERDGRYHFFEHNPDVRAAGCHRPPTAEPVAGQCARRHCHAGPQAGLCAHHGGGAHCAAGALGGGGRVWRAARRPARCRHSAGLVLDQRAAKDGARRAARAASDGRGRGGFCRERAVRLPGVPALREPRATRRPARPRGPARRRAPDADQHRAQPQDRPPQRGCVSAARPPGGAHTAAEGAGAPEATHSIAIVQSKSCASGLFDAKPLCASGCRRGGIIPPLPRRRATDAHPPSAPPPTPTLFLPVPPSPSPWRLSGAPMMDWTDRHCRYFHRLLTRQTRLYTEMVNAGAVLHGGTERHLRLNAEEHPVALQLGGNEPAALARAARLGAQWGYDEINLKCGCPSDRVQRGAFGARLMQTPQRVADCVKAMRDMVDRPVTVKHRIGIDQGQSYGFVRDFVGVVADAGCSVFIVHARNAWLQGLSPKENREIPPLRYALVHQLKADFPRLTVVINGGIATDAVVQQQLHLLDGVMVGRQAYHQPWWLARWDALYYANRSGPCAGASPLTREAVERAMVAYMEREAALHGTPWPHIARHMLGLRHSLPGARLWRQLWSDHRLKDRPAREVHALALRSYAARAGDSG